jgi:hypothetical protein
VRPPSGRKLVRRLLEQAGYASGLLLISLVLGMVGYHWIARLSWVDAFENASMLLGGMGPVGEISTDAGKIFSGLYALYAGVIFLAVTALMLAPVVHHVLHRFHWEMNRPE